MNRRKGQPQPKSPVAEGKAAQRIGRALHDAPELAALRLALSRLKDLHDDTASLTLLDEIEDCLRQIGDELRAISVGRQDP